MNLDAWASALWFHVILKDFLIWIHKNLGPWGPLVFDRSFLNTLDILHLLLPLTSHSEHNQYAKQVSNHDLQKIGRSYVESKLKDYPQFQAVAVATQRSGFKIVLLLRLVPLLPFNVLNYLLSVTPVSIGEYMLASWIGMMPVTLGLVYVGTTIKDLSDVTHNWRDISTARWILMTAGLVASVVLIILVAQVARKSLNKALDESDGKVNGILVATDSALENDPCVDLQQPLIIKIETSVDNHNE